MYDKEASNKELIELCEVVGADITAKNPSKPTKAELCAALDGYYGVADEMEMDLPDGIEDDDTPVQVKAVGAKTPMTKAQVRRAQYETSMKLVRVLVTSNATNQTKTDLITIGWGNRLLGYYNDRVILGKPWHIRAGALQNMRDRTISSPVQNEEHNRIDYVTIPAYNIVDLGLLSMAEYRAMGEKQKAKEASLSIQ